MKGDIMPIKVKNTKEYDIQDFEEWRASPDYKNSRQKVIKSGTEVPEILMPNSPLEDMTNDNTQETIAVSAIVENTEESENSISLIVTAFFGILIGILITVIFFQKKSNKIEPHV